LGLIGGVFLLGGETSDAGELVLGLGFADLDFDDGSVLLHAHVLLDDCSVFQANALIVRVNLVDFW
jgi:hypothetical protein